MKKIKDISRRISILGEFWQFLKQEKKWWLIPIIVILILLGIVIISAGGNLSYLIYTLF